MSLSARNKMTPQMLDYDRIGDQWVPYLMRSDGALKNFSSVNTDKWGMRWTIGRQGAVLTVDAIAAEAYSNSIGVILGSSAVFGVGSSQDQFTISSYLSNQTKVDWLNFGGRAYNSTQELFRLILHLPKKMDQLVVFSGVNNITLSFLSSYSSPVYNSFFYQSSFQQSMEHSSEFIGVRRAWGRLLKELRNRFFKSSESIPNELSRQTYKDVLICFERDLRALKVIADGIGANVYFVMQPLATWIEKRLSEEEVTIFNLLDSMSSDWIVLAKQIADIKERYFEDVENICIALNINYYNMNLAPEFNTKEWLFVDRVHLTDRGYELAARLIKKRFNL